jgi:hypothetical protein
VRGLHVSGDLVVALLCGFADELPLPHKLVPVDAAAAPLSAPLALAIGIELAPATLVDHCPPSFHLAGPPPFLPFCRAIARMRIDIEMLHHLRFSWVTSLAPVVVKPTKNLITEVGEVEDKQASVTPMMFHCLLNLSADFGSVMDFPCPTN